MTAEVTWESIYALINRMDRKIERISQTGARFIARGQIIKEIGESNYTYGVQKGRLNEIKGPARNSRILIERTQYENFLLTMKK
jgi:hypothetical protein